ncbi:Serine/threonine/tyrosine-interacting-like protein 1 [Holothuria leucospilota]|uniref:Serine/threonine/tyrosine-interacting-like protein 1 n=1 Tax=Holothuria leucospilota TaxID=206669 RepID=A0A9Q1HEN1_HOLLE|nr:Serine/threonine/tyrosine-interacting-like protein 1 [Holothuria leucospilota]
MSASNRIVMCEPTELYNILQQQATIYPCLSDPNYLLLLDARQTNEYNESHILTSKKAPRSENGDFLVPYDAELECKMYVIVVDNNTSLLQEKGPALKCAKLLAEMGSRNPVKILRGGYEEFSALYPFLRTHKIIYMPQELDELKPYPVEVLPGRLYLGTSEQVNRAAVRKDLKVKAIIHTSDDTGELESTLAAGIELKHIPFLDDDDADMYSKFAESCEFIGNYVKDAKSVLVCSDHGLSRSVTIVLVYLMHHYKWPLKDAFKHLQGCKWNIRPRRNFIQQLSKWEMELFDETVTDITDTIY